ncbi:MAG: hypothetical protein K5697_00500 [Lachnospiraceae bacterium]|nr:hypothetical protein [Lachnospiraceae bacterium]
MNARQVADDADMIVAGYAYKVKDGYVEVVDLEDTGKVSTIQSDVISESLMSDEEDAIVLKYYLRNKNLLEESLYA